MKNNTTLHGYNPMPLCDSHIHIHHSDRAGLPITIDDTCTFIKNLMIYFSYDRLNIQALTPYGGALDLAINAKALYCKAKLNKQFAPERQVYVNANLMHVFNTGLSPEEELLRQAKVAYAAGFDGIKLLDGKPIFRRQLGYGLNDSRYEPFLQFIIEHDFPLVLHTGDPHEMWEELVDSNGVKQPPHFDSSFVTMPQLRDELEQMLEKYPMLKITLAHFYFWGAELEQLSAFLDRYPNVCLDIVPACEEFFDLNKDPATAREFFIKYSDRILFGSDCNNWHSSESLDEYQHCFGNIINLPRNYLEAKAPFRFVDNDRGEITPLQLEEEYLKKIYHDNFVRIYGETARPVNYDLALELVNEVAPIYNDPSRIIFPNREKFGGLEFTSLASREINVKNLETMAQFFETK